MTIAEAYKSQEDYPTEPANHATPEAILDAVSSFSRVSVEDLKAKRRKQHQAQARFLAMWLLREVTGMSFPKIGLILGRDHSTVIHGCDLIDSQMRERPAWGVTVRKLQARLS